MMNILTQLQSYKKFSHNEQQLVDYILQHPDEVLELSSKEFSQKCFVSTATIYRLCEKLDLSGFSELKVRISTSLHNYQKNDHFDFNFPIQKHQTHYQMIQSIQDDYEKTIQSTANLFDLDELKRVVYAMSKAKGIDIYTSSANIYFAQNFAFQMKEIGIDVNVPVDEYQQRLYASSSNEHRLAIVISFEGRGLVSEIIPEILKKNHTPVVLMSSPNYQLNNVNYHLYISPFENHACKVSSFSTRLSILYIFDILYSCYFELDYQNNLEKKMKYYSYIHETNPKPKK